MSDKTVLNQQKRATWAQYVVPNTGAMAIIVPYNRNRVALLISCDMGAAIVMSREPTIPGAAGQNFTETIGPFELTLLQHGAMVHGPIYARGSIGAVTITVWESLNSED